MKIFRSKQNLTLALVVMLFFIGILLSNKSYATEYYYGNNIKYELTDYWAGSYHKNNIVAQITWINGYCDEITIPSTVTNDGKTYTVKSIGDIVCREIYNENYTLGKVNLPNTIEYIGNEAFKGCKNLTSFEMPDSIRKLGQGVFEDCTGLTSIRISLNIKELEYRFMKGCTGIKNVTVPNGVEILGYDCFTNCSSLTSISLPNTLKEIGKNAFMGCSSMTSFTMPDSVTSLSGTGISSIFNNCTKLKTIKLSNNLTYLPSQTFQSCTSLEEIILPDKIKTIGSHVFSDCPNLKRLSIPQQVNDIDWGFINGAPNVKEIIYPAEYRNHKIWQMGTVSDMTFVFPRTIEKMDDGGTYTNCTAYGFSETPVKKYCQDNGITFKELPLLEYSTHVQNMGDQTFVTNGVMAGTSGKGLRLENISIKLNTSKTGYSGGISYSTHIQNKGWQNPVQNGLRSGTMGEGLRLEAIKINLTGQVANYFDVYYRVHAQNFGWLDWAKNGEPSGTQGYEYRLEGIEILILPKTLKYAPGKTEEPFKAKKIITVAELSDTNISLTKKWQTKTLTANFKIDNVPVTDITWTSSNPNVATVEKNGRVIAVASGNAVITAKSNSKGITATCNVRVSVTNSDYIKGDVDGNGIVNASDAATLYNWMGESTTSERLKIADMNGDGVLDKKDVNIIIDYYTMGAPVARYTTHVQNIGWQEYVTDGQMAGTSGKGLRLEGIKINLKSPISGGISYRTHVQNIGWQNFVSNDAVSGTAGRSLRLEAIQINLTGDISKVYDVYYRVHAQNVGWLDWAKNGEMSGTEGFGFRLEGIEIKLVAKGNTAPGVTDKPFMSTSRAFGSVDIDLGTESIILESEESIEEKEIPIAENNNEFNLEEKTDITKEENLTSNAVIENNIIIEENKEVLENIDNTLINVIDTDIIRSNEDEVYNGVKENTEDIYK